MIQLQEFLDIANVSGVNVTVLSSIPFHDALVDYILLRQKSRERVRRFKGNKLVAFLSVILCCLFSLLETLVLSGGECVFISLWVDFGSRAAFGGEVP